MPPTARIALNCKELSYLDLLLERLGDQGSAKLLARLYQAFLAQRISFDELRRYAQLLERLLPRDYEMLRDYAGQITYDGSENAAPLRPVGFGPVVERTSVGFDEAVVWGRPAGKDGALPDAEYGYRRTLFGDKLVECVEFPAQ